MHSADPVAPCRTLHLLGFEGLARYVEQVQRYAVPGDAACSDEALIGEWRAAQARLADLTATQPGPAAEAAPAVPLPAWLDARLQAVLARPEVQASFSQVPVAPAWVEIDSLVAYQREIDLDKADAIAASLGPDPDLGRCFDLAFGVGEPASPADWRLLRQKHSAWEFGSDSHDFRYLGARLFDPALLPDLAVDGRAVAAVALLLGYSANLVSVLRLGSRWVLHNGYHRVYALRRLGITRVPCLVEVLASTDELALVAAAEISEQVALYFHAPRPPCFRDFFDPALMRVHARPRLRRQVRLAVSVDSPLIAP